MDPLRLADVRAGDATQTRSHGSGYLIAPRLVLTALHVTRQRTSGVPWPHIDVHVGHPRSGDVAHRLAAVRWTHPGGHDVALLELDAPVDVPGEVRWGDAGGRELLAFRGLAFPLATRTAEGHRKVEQLHGTLPPLSGGRGLHDLLVLNHPFAPGEREDGLQAWAGASGAAVFCGDSLVGVVIHDDEAFNNQRLHACRTRAFVTDDDFAGVLRAHDLTPPDPLEVIEAPGAHARQQQQPTAAPHTDLPDWLGPLTDDEPVMFVGRNAELRNARTLTAEGGRILPVVGPEHIGKSAFIERLTTDKEFRRALPGNRPWGLLEFEVPGGGSRSPVSRALAAKIGVTMFDAEEHDLDSSSTERRVKHMLATLAGAARGHNLVTVIDCGRCRARTADLEADLDEVLGNSAFRRSLVLIASTTSVQASGNMQLRRMPPVLLGPLSTDEATELLDAELTKYQVRVDAGQVVGLAGESLVRRPGVLLYGVDQHVRSYAGALGPHDPDPVDVAVDLLDACRTTVVEVFDKAGLRLIGEAGAPGVLAPLVVWATTERLPLPQDVLTTCGVDPGTLRHLTYQGVLVERQQPTGTPHFELSRATREALRNITLAALGLDEGGYLRARESAVLGPAADDRALLDRTLHAAASQVFPTTLAHFADEEGNAGERSLLFAVEVALGWVGARTDGRLPQLHRWVGDFANSLDMESLEPPSALPAQEQEPAQEQAQQPIGEPARADAATTGTTAGATPTPVPAPAPRDDDEALFRAVSDLNLRMRAPVTDEARTRFVAACERAVDTLCRHVPGFPPQILRSIENALYLGGRRFGCHTDMLRIRARAAQVLSEGARQMTRGRVGRLAWTVSWLLNTADLQSEGGQKAEGRSSLALARELLGQLPEPDTVGGEATRIGLRMRAARALARTADRDQEQEQAEALAEAVRLGCLGLERCAPTTGLRHLWTRRLLDAAKHQAFELRGDDERSATVALVMDALVGSYGPVAAWGLPVRLTVVRFLRSVHRRQADPVLRLAGADEAMALLLPCRQAVVQQAEDGDSGGLLELARTADFKSWSLEQNERLREAVAEARTAVEYAAQAVHIAPSARAHRVWLECVSHCDKLAAGGPESRATRTELRRAVRRTREWLDTQEATTKPYAQLARLCIVVEWHLRGRSLWQAVAAAKEASAREAQVEDSELVRRAYHERVRTLEGHGNRFGWTVGTALLRCDLEREYQRLRVVQAHGSARKKLDAADYTSAWNVLDRAPQPWRSGPEILLAHARLHRYLWNYEGAAEDLEQVILVTRSGQERRQAQLELAEALLRHVRFGSPDPAERTEFLERAAANLEEPLSHRFESERVIVLRERIRLEAGAPVDQERIDAAFEKLIGTDYATTIGRYLHNRRYAPRADPGAENPGNPQDPQGEQAPHGEVRVEEPQNLAQLLYENFTDTELIDGIGQLYLRQAELRGASDDPELRREAAAAALKAYDCFDACRVLQEAHHPREPIVNRFKRAEAVKQAARLSGTADPVPWPPEGKTSWLTLARDLFQSASGGSVGTFHDLCVSRISETQRLLNHLTPGGGRG